MNWHEKNAEFNTLIKQLFHEKNWQKRAEAARLLGLKKDGRATNLLCRALRSEKDHTVINGPGPGGAAAHQHPAHREGSHPSGGRRGGLARPGSRRPARLWHRLTGSRRAC